MEPNTLTTQDIELHLKAFKLSQWAILTLEYLDGKPEITEEELDIVFDKIKRTRG